MHLNNIRFLFTDPKKIALNITPDTQNANAVRFDDLDENNVYQFHKILTNLV